MVHLKNVGKWYYKSEKVLDSINLHLKKGDFLYVLGGSGVGKSSLLRLLASEEKPSVGSVELFGYDLAKVNSLTLKAIRRSIGYMPQDVRLIPDLSVYDNVFLSLKLSGKKKTPQLAQNNILELLDKLGLVHKRKDNCETLSGGEAQRVAFARALIRSPELIIADEPTGAQDRAYTWLMMDEFVKANNSGATLLLATHDQEILRRVQKKWVTLRSGKIQLEERMLSL